MSKSYGNTIQCLLEEELYKLVMRIKTNSQTVEEPKDPETCTIFMIYRNFATPRPNESLRRRLSRWRYELERSKRRAI